jgi:hypothetical protein
MPTLQRPRLIRRKRAASGIFSRISGENAHCHCFVEVAGQGVRGIHIAANVNTAWAGLGRETAWGPKRDGELGTMARDKRGGKTPQGWLPYVPHDPVCVADR